MLTKFLCRQSHAIEKRCAFLLVLLSMAFVSGCSTVTSKSTPAPEAQSAAVVETTPKPIPTDTLYGLLTAEIAGQRQRYDVAYTHYMHQAEITQAPNIAERATRIAQFIGQRPLILQAAQLWAQIDSKNPQPYLIASQALVEQGKHEQALDYLAQIQVLTEKSQYDFLATNAAHLPEENKHALLSRLTLLQEQHPQDASLWLATGLMKQHLRHYPEALADTEQAIKLTPASIRARLQKARLLALTGKQAQSIKLLKRLEKEEPTHKGVRLLKARILLDQKKLTEARDAFHEIYTLFPLDPNIILSLALINEDLGDKDNAQEYFYQLLAIQEFTNEAHFYLGRMADTDAQHDYAIEQYGQVSSGPEFFSAKLRAMILTKEHYGFEAAQQFLHEQMHEYHQHRLSLIRLEAELLAENKQYDAAQALLTQALAEQKDNIDLLYSRAMVAERGGNLVLAEQDLRQILAMAPNNINALNALGYTFADHNYNLDEALELIQKAYDLAPNNPAITDSLGWVHFRLGNFQQAIQLLERAYNIIQDHEIAAHYGELLWLDGDTEQALKVWSAGYKNQSDSPVLNETIKRLKVNRELLPSTAE